MHDTDAEHERQVAAALVALEGDEGDALALPEGSAERASEAAERHDGV